MIRVKDLNSNLARKPEEITKFTYLIRMLVWAKGKTGKSSAEIISLVLRRGKMDIERSCYF